MGPYSDYLTDFALKIVREKQLKQEFDKVGIKYPDKQEHLGFLQNVFDRDTHQRVYVQQLEMVYAQSSRKLKKLEQPKVEIWTESQVSKIPFDLYPDVSPWVEREATFSKDIKVLCGELDKEEIDYPFFLPELVPTFSGGANMMEITYWNNLQKRDHLYILEEFERRRRRVRFNIPEKEDEEMKDED